ncbi:hypothetical protein DPEC_G00004790 [Dallia pectoralis]|uniref:Uncharacterized protein n=1 Tax=Dallia pectoralis TaxID=75939 RepID=A0ACC2HK44_DALPE|nr:hypothetical protein DPEC_G00004790 [Dallia pectoralis]
MNGSVSHSTRDPNFALPVVVFKHSVAVTHTLRTSPTVIIEEVRTMNGITQTTFYFDLKLKGCASVLLLLATSSWCSALPSAVLQVNCSSLDLTEVPPLSPDTTELHLQDNHLSRVPPGHFDRLQSLRSITLSGNPFHCDCGIQYLRSWVRRNRAVVSGAVPTCASPSSVAHREISSLSDDHFSSCARQSCVDGPYGVLVGSVLCGVIGLLIWVLRLAKSSTFTLDITQRHAGLNLESLRSLKPKHRSRLRRTQHGESENTALLSWTDDTSLT